MATDKLMADQHIVWPPTNEVDAQRKQAFLDAIDPEAVCRLTSGLNNGKPCHIFRESTSGSFNVCFFVEFTPETKWVVRIPIKPALYDPWTKLQSEVATMRYVEAKTTIPIPHVHFYGQGVFLGRPESVDAAGSVSCCYLILDYVVGQPLDLEVFLEDTSARQQRHIYRQLVGILAQLRQLEFDTGGSLMPGPDNNAERPVMGPLQSSGYNEVQRLTGGRAHAQLGVYHTAAGFAWAQLHLLQKAYEDVPMESTTLAHARMETFALQDVEQRLGEVVGSDEGQDGRRPFVLAHTDLRWSNILVTDDLTICSIIDWEWSAVVPARLFFLPPTWIAGASPCYVASLAYEKAYGEFYQLVEEEAAGSDRHREGARKLADAWGPDLPARIDLPLAILLQQHYNLVPAYYFSIFPKLYPVRPTCMPPQTVARLFAEDAEQKQGGGPLTQAVRRRMAAVTAYRRHLEAGGLLVEYELADETRAWLRKRDRLHAQMLAQMLAQSTALGRAPPAEAARVLQESVLQASIQPRNIEPVLGEGADLGQVLGKGDEDEDEDD